MCSFSKSFAALQNFDEQVKEHCIQMAAHHQCSLSEEQTMIPFTIEVSPTEAVMTNGGDLTSAGQGQGQPGADSSEQQQVRTGC